LVYYGWLQYEPAFGCKKLSLEWLKQNRFSSKLRHIEQIRHSAFPELVRFQKYASNLASNAKNILNWKKIVDFRAKLRKHIGFRSHFGFFCHFGQLQNF
jgi:hypothetical protein